jgi:hypothetical protein
MFPHGVNPKTGEIIEKRHELLGKNLRGKVFVFPYGIGSTTGGTWVLETIRCGNAPVAMINIETETIIATGVILAEMIYGKALPVIDRLDRNPVEVIETGDWVAVDGNTGTVVVTKRKRHRT